MIHFVYLYCTKNEKRPLLQSIYNGKDTLPDCFERVCDVYPDRRALGTRELLSEMDEKQPNGKVFKKVRNCPFLRNN